MSSISSQLIPEDAQWSIALKPFTAQMPNGSLAITNILGGAIHMISRDSEKKEGDLCTVSYDANGYSSILRMVAYSTRLINDTKVFQYLAGEHRVALFRHMSVFVQLASDNLGVPHQGGIWLHKNHDIETAIIDLIAETQTLLAGWLRSSLAPDPSFIDIGLEKLFEESKGVTTFAYYAGRAYAALATEIKELHGHAYTAQNEEHLKKIRSTPSMIASVAFVTSISDSKGLLRLCNELIANLTGLFWKERIHEGTSLLIIG